VRGRESRDPGIWRFVERHLRPGDTFVDAGANIGAYSVPAARLVGPTDRVFAFEAHPRTFALLRHNIEANGLGWARPFDLALSDAEGELEMAFAEGNPGETYVATGLAGGVWVRAATLDEALGAECVAAVDYLQIDVEGFELPVLRGARKILAHSPRIAVQTEMQERHAARYGHCLGAIAELLGSAGLRPHHPDGAGVPQPLRGAPLGDVIWLR